MWENLTTESAFLVRVHCEFRLSSDVRLSKDINFENYNSMNNGHKNKKIFDSF